MDETTQPDSDTPDMITMVRELHDHLLGRLFPQVSEQNVKDAFALHAGGQMQSPLYLPSNALANSASVLVRAVDEYNLELILTINGQLNSRPITVRL